MKKLFLISALLVLMSGSNVSYCQTTSDTHEISTSVPELSAFHKVIQPMWHKLYPAKDIAGLKALVPQIKGYMEKMNSAKLPGILREKEANWKAQLVKFNQMVEEYYKAADGNDDEAMLKAAEKFHAGYEAMNRVIKPFFKEMDEYHVTLYVIYHNYLPEKKYDEIAAVMDKFIAQADLVAKYPEEKLIKRLKDKTPKFYEVSKNLNDATVALKEVLAGNDAKKKDAAVEKVHNIYQKLEAVFE
jgi:hypothetical protein